MAIYDFFLSRNNNVTVNEYVGHADRLFFDPAERVLRISDGVTAGGEVFNGLVTVANTEPTANFQGQLWLNPQTYDLSVYHNGDFIPTIDVATETKLGGIKLGPGVTVNGDGQIIIDSEGLDFSFGNLAATVGTYPADYYQAERQDEDYAVLSSINANEDIVFASNGTGAVRVVGDFSVRRANGNLVSALEEEPIFRVKGDGQVQMLVPAADSAEGAFTIVGGLDGVFQAPVNTGVMLHITGIASSPDPTPSRIYNDAQNSFGAFVTRRYNGTAAAPTAVLDGEEILRLSGTAHNGTLIPGTGNQRIIYKALGNQTPSNQGGIIEFLATPLNSTTLSKVATLSSTGITLESGKVLTGNVTGNVSGSAGSVAAANITGTTLAATVVTSSLTTVGTLTNLSVTNTITGSVSGNAGTVTNGVYTTGSYANPSWITSLAGSKVTNAVLTTDTGTVTNTMLAGSIANNKLTNSTISGIALGSNLAALTIDGYLLGTSYNGSTGVTISVDATTAATASKVVARDANAIVAGSNFQGTVRNAGAVQGTTVTLDFNSDHMVHCTFIDNFTVAFANYTAGRTITLIATNTSGADTDIITAGISSVRMQGDSTLTVTEQTTAIVTYYCVGTTVNDVYASAVYA
jgi:hypothetical protein